MIKPETRDLIDTALRSVLDPWGYDGFEAVSRADSDGDPSIFIVARFTRPETIPPSTATTRAMVTVLDRLRAAGDARVPYLDYRFPSDPADDEAD